MAGELKKNLQESSMQYEEIVDEMPASAVWMINDDAGRSCQGVRAFQEKRKPDFPRWEK